MLCNVGQIVNCRRIRVWVSWANMFRPCTILDEKYYCITVDFINSFSVSVSSGQNYKMHQSYINIQEVLCRYVPMPVPLWGAITTSEILYVTQDSEAWQSERLNQACFKIWITSFFFTENQFGPSCRLHKIGIWVLIRLLFLLIHV